MYKTIKMWNYFDIFGESFLWLSIKIVKKKLSLMKNNWNHKYETIPPIPCKFANSFQVQLEENEQIPITVFTRIHWGLNENTASTQTVKMSPFS